MRIIYVPIEPYPVRYTADWIEQFENEFRNNNIEYLTILGEKTTSQLRKGEVLDSCGTNLYKFSQLHKIIQMIQDKQITDNDAFLFADIWFPGIESLFYIRNSMNLKFKIFGILHAGTYDKFDFTFRYGMRSWGKEFEKCVLEGVDAIFLATEFHKKLILQSYSNYDNKLIVTGIPFYSQELKNKYLTNEPKKPIIVFPHRDVPEKRPDIFEKISKMYPQYKFIKTLEVCKNRDEYFNLLNKSSIMISIAEQETFGYSTLECMSLGNYVIVPNKLSYKETVPDKYRYEVGKTDEETICNIRKLLDKFNSKTNYDYSLDKWSQSILNMLNYIKENN